MSELLTLTIAVAVFAVVATAVLATRRTKPTPIPKKNSDDITPTTLDIEPIKTVAISTTALTSVKDEDVRKAEEDLRILNVEKEIVSYALTRLYEAQAEGKITEGDKTRLLSKYKGEMGKLEKQINDKQLVVRLHELEITQADLVKLFQDKFEEITRNIETIRINLGLVPKPEPIPRESIPEPVPKEKKVEEKPAPRTRQPAKSKAEEKIESIQQEVLKILERLDKQETEA